MVALSARTGGSRHTGLAAPPHENNQFSEKGIEKESLANKKAMQLMGLLAEQGRIEDIKKASVDQEYLQSLLWEFFKKYFQGFFYYYCFFDTSFILSCK